MLPCYVLSQIICSAMLGILEAKSILQIGHRNQLAYEAIVVVQKI